MKSVLFIDRDGTLIKEPPVNFQVDSLDKLEFYPGVFTWLGRIVRELDYELVMVTNQDGLGTTSFPESDFWPAQHKMCQALEGEGIVFTEILIDRSFEGEKLETRKPRIGLLTNYLSDEYDLKNSFVIGDRITDMILAKNLGAAGIYLSKDQKENSELSLALQTESWKAIYEFLKLGLRVSNYQRNTRETKISLDLNLGGNGITEIDTGIAFFDHMLDQLGKHGGVDLSLKVEGDLEVDEHHTIEDTGIALGEAFSKALGNKMGIERYGYCLPMDDALVMVALDFGGRNWIEWKADFRREMIGKMPTEMFFHFFKSFSDGAKCNLNIKAEGINEHHKIEAIFKAFAKAIKMAIKRDVNHLILPTTKGML